MVKKGKSESVPEHMEATYQEIIAMTNEVCRDHLDEEYAQMCRAMAAALARKRPSPLMGGKPRTWACGIVYTVGMVNFLFDKSQTPYMRADDLCAAFGLSSSSGSAKSKQVRQILKVRGQFDPNWCLPSRLADNPLVWLLTVNGMIVDARYMPRAVQEEAYRRGMIPYLPDEPPI
ncbi:MAG: hypothetical protein HY231_19270 [Acidobacteria bacterium]|nr:hypothetical protein [Acidobacteriota bacterium]